MNFSPKYCTYCRLPFCGPLSEMYVIRRPLPQSFSTAAPWLALTSSVGNLAKGGEPTNATPSDF